LNLFLLNILLALVWCLLWGSFDMGVMLSGLLFGLLLLALITRNFDHPTYGRRLFRVVSFLGYFVKILIQSNWSVAKVLMKPGFNESPRIVRYSVDGLTDAQITTLANTITLTPGTLSMDISADKKTLYIHCMFGVSRDQITRDLDDLRIRMMRELFE
jgi:multicomponent Na+:H+ antiporter subunit E